MKHNYTRFGLSTWPDSQQFVSDERCILVCPPEVENDPCALDSAYFIPEEITGPLEENGSGVYVRIPFPESQKWLDRIPEEYGPDDEYDEILTDYDSQDAYVLESLLDEEPEEKPLKKYRVTLYYHTSVTVEVETEDEEDAKNVACNNADNDELLANLQEDDDPDVVEV